MLETYDRKNARRQLGFRRKKFTEETVRANELDHYQAEGWELVKRNKTSIRVRKAKPHNQIFEERIWKILYEMEFDEIGGGSDFGIPIAQDRKAKQVDAFGICEFGALVVECKSNEAPGRRAMRKDLSEYVAMREKMVESICGHAGRTVDVAIVFATRNIIWAQPDLEFAKEHRILVLQDSAIDYYETLAKHIGAAAQFQLFGDALGTKKTHGSGAKVAAMRGNMAGNEFYLFAATANILLPISYVAHRANLGGDVVSAYQRMVQRNRLTKIRKYIEENGALFPNSIIVNFHDRDALNFSAKGSDEQGFEFGLLELPADYRSAWVIDGQHRLVGLAGTKQVDDALLPVVAFAGLDSSTQARMFVDINSKQVKVQKNLLEEIFADLLWGSDDANDRLAALAAKTVAFLNSTRGSPLFRQVKGGSDLDGTNRPITITTLAGAIRSGRLYGHVPAKTTIIEPGPFFVSDTPDLDKSLRRGVALLSDYLQFFAQGIPDQWRLGDEKGGYLCTNQGIAALLLVYKQLLDHISKSRSISIRDLSQEELHDELAPLIGPLVDYFKRASPPEIDAFRRLYGLAGQSKAAYEMMLKIRSVNRTFNAPGLDEHLASQDDSYTETATLLIRNLQIAISSFVLDQLKSRYPNGKDWWWEGVPSEIRKKVVARIQDDPERPSEEQSFDLLDYKNIATANWELLGPALGRNEEGQGKQKQIAWFQELNKLRNRTMHPERGVVTRDELHWLEALVRHLEKSLGTDINTT
jgi:DNA sulfur modification protein DndB